MALLGNEVLQVLGKDGNSFPAASTFLTTTAEIAGLASGGSTSIAIGALATVGAGTLTAALINGKIVARSGSQSATAFTDTTGTADAIIALLPNGASTTVGTAYGFTYQNTTNAPATLTGGSGVTVSGAT